MSLFKINSIYQFIASLSCTLLLLGSFNTAFSQSLGLGTDYPDPQAILDIKSNNKGVLLSRLTLVERNTNLAGLNASDVGLLIYNTTDSVFNYWNGIQWIDFPGTAAAAANDNDWDRDTGNGYLFPFNLADNVGIGTTSPIFPLTINASNKGNGMYVSANFTGTLGTGANAISTSVSGISTQKLNAISQNVSANGSGNRSGLFTTFEGNGTGQIVGVESYFNNTGNGSKTGVKNTFEFGTTGIQYGMQNSFALSGTTSLYGVENQFFSTNNVNHYGFWNDMTTNGAGTQFGMMNAMSSSGTGLQIGVNNPINNTGSNNSIGVFNDLGGNSSGPKIGVKNEIGDNGSNSHYGVQTLILSNGIGDRYGVYNEISNNGSGDITGIGSLISNIGGGTHYGSNIQMTGTGLGDKYGSKIFIDNNAGGTHYGLHSEVLKSGSYAAYLLGNIYIGTNTTNGYLLPSTDGNNGEVISTDGSGQSNWAARVQKVIFKDVQPSATLPPVLPPATWSTRPLNTTEGSATFASLSGNQITLQPGSYLINATCPIRQSGDGTMQSILYNITASTTLLEGIAMRSLSGSDFDNLTPVKGIITIATATTVELRSFCTLASYNGFPFSSPGTNNTFTILEIEKLD
ncbi:MAG: hypothetical protein R2753_16395 [Chitinophagales bacterium]